jgi:hypothetical protein
MSTAFWILAALILGYYVGWANAHYTVATECDRLGSFFVGKRVFKCTEISEVKP